MLCDMHEIPGGLMECSRCGKPVKRIKKSYYRNCALPEPAGTAGTHLKRLLFAIGISTSSGCKCSSRATHMDRMGNDWCEQNIETIVEWLKEEAAARGLPFISTVGRMLVRKAISNARREAERAKDTA